MAITFIHRYRFVAGIGVLAIVILVSYRHFHAPVEVPEQALSVTTATAISADVAEGSAYTGTLVPVQEVDIAAKGSGTLSSLFVDVGSRVVTGETLAQLDVSQARAMAQSLSDSIEAAQHSLEAVDASYAQEIANLVSSASSTETASQTAMISSITDVAIVASKVDDTLGILLSVRKGEPTSVDSVFSDTYLSARDAQAKINARMTLARFQNENAAFQAKYHSKILGGSPDQADVEDSLTQAVTLLNDAKTALSQAYTVLLNTVPSQAVGGNVIESEKAQVTALGTEVQNILQHIHNTTTGLSNLQSARKAQVAQAQAQVVSLQGQAVVNETLLADGVIRAPFSGVITQKDIERGAVVGSGTPLLHLSDDSSLKVVVGIPESNVGDFHVGDRAVVLVGGTQTVSARITKMNPSVDAVSRSMPVELTIDNSDHKLREGSYARVLFSKSHAANVAVPRSALTLQYDTSYVFVLEGNTAMRRVVVTGAQSDDLVEIVSGVKPGEVVITAHLESLRDGDAVEVLRANE